MEDYTRDFYVFSYFGKTYEEMTKKSDGLILQCAERAYLDLNRTLLFSTQDKHSRNSWRKNICGIIGEKADELISDEGNFDSIHYSICESIIKAADNPSILEIITPSSAYQIESQRFYFGQAQKWLNMTLKYMMILGYKKEKFEKVKGKIHIPIDSIILKVAAGSKSSNAAKQNCNYWLQGNAPIDHKAIKLESDDFDDICDELETIRNNESVRFGPYSDTYKPIPWSKWSNVDYLLFLNELRSRFKEWKKNTSKKEFANWELVDWEHHAWIAQASLEKQKPNNA